MDNNTNRNENYNLSISVSDSAKTRERNAHRECEQDFYCDTHRNTKSFVIENENFTLKIRHLPAWLDVEDIKNFNIWSEIGSTEIYNKHLAGYIFGVVDPKFTLGELFRRVQRFSAVKISLKLDRMLKLTEYPVVVEGVDPETGHLYLAGVGNYENFSLGWESHKK